MISKGIWVGLVAITFVAGSLMTGTMAFAASNSQGQPFQALQEQVDSFFDIFVEVDVFEQERAERIAADTVLQKNIDSIIDSQSGEVAIVRCTTDGTGTPSYIFQSATLTEGIPQPDFSPGGVNCAEAIAYFESLGLTEIHANLDDSSQVLVYTLT